MKDTTYTALCELDEIHGTQFAPPIGYEELGSYRSRWSEAEDSVNWHGALQSLVREMLASGLTLEQAGKVVSRHPSMVASYLTIDPVLAPAFVRADKLLRTGELSHRQIAAQVGLTAQQVDRLASLTKQKSKAAQQLEAGGGLKWDATVLNQILELRNDGFSYGEISKITGVPMGTVKSHVRRNRKAE